MRTVRTSFRSMPLSLLFLATPRFCASFIEVNNGVPANGRHTLFVNRNPERYFASTNTRRSPTWRLYSTKLPEIESMRLREIKEELESYGISTRSFLEKTELVDALQKARADGLKPKARASTSSSSPSASSNASTTSSSQSTTTSSSQSTKSREERIREEMEKLQSVKASELREELKELGVSTASFFEKSEFVKALAEARVDGVKGSSGESNTEGYAEYTDVEVLTDDSAGPRKKQDRQQQAQQQSPFGGAGNPFGAGAGASPFGGAGASPFGAGGMGGIGNIADMLKNMGMGGAGAAGANPFGGAAGANPFGGGGFGGMGDAMGKAQELMKNPKVREIIQRAQSNPSIMKKVNEFMSNPTSFAKYQNDPDVAELINELRKYM